MEELKQEILDLSMNYFELMDEDISQEFIALLISSLIDNYKTKRNYPESYTEEMINADCIRYFSKRKTDTAMALVPELYGRIGAEGLAMLTDAGTVRMWKDMSILDDVVPLCEVV